MLRGGQHVDQVRDLAVGAMHLRIDHDRDVGLRARAPRGLHRGQGRIGRILHPDHHLDGSGMVLVQEGQQVPLESDFVAAQGLQERQGGGDDHGLGRPAGQPAGQGAGGDRIGGADQAEDEGRYAEEVDHGHPEGPAAFKLGFGALAR